MGIDDLLKLLKSQGPEAVLSKVDSPEMAAMLKGEQRGAYLEALDQVYGPKATRAELSGKNLRRIEQREATKKLINDLGISIVNNKAKTNEGRSYDFISNDGSSIGRVNIAGGGLINAKLDPSLQGKGMYRKLLEDHALKYGSVDSLHTLRNKKSDKVWDQIVQDGFAERFNEAEIDDMTRDAIKPMLNRSSEAAFDPRFKDSKNRMAAVAAAPMVSMNPLEPLADILGGYRGVQERVADAITERTSFVKPDSTQKALGRAVIDPLNLVEGPAALGAMFIDAITPREENE